MQQSELCLFYLFGIYIINSTDINLIINISSQYTQFSTCSTCSYDRNADSVCSDLTCFLFCSKDFVTNIIFSELNNKIFKDRV